MAALYQSKKKELGTIGAVGMSLLILYAVLFIYVSFSKSQEHAQNIFIAIILSGIVGGIMLIRDLWTR